MEKRKNRLSSPLIARLGSREVRVVHGGPVPDVRLDELPRVDGVRLRLDVPLEPKRHRLVAPLERRALDGGEGRVPDEVVRRLFPLVHHHRQNVPRLNEPVRQTGETRVDLRDYRARRLEIHAPRGLVQVLRAETKRRKIDEVLSAVLRT